MATRGKVAVSRDSWMWRVYETWSRRANDSRAVVDLCHFMRVLLIFAPIRWFFQATWKIGGKLSIQPWLVVFTTGIVTLTTLVVTTYPEMSWLVLQFMALGVAVGSVLVGAVYLIVRNWSDEAQEKLIDFFIVLFAPLWLPIVGVAIAIEKAWNYAIAPAGYWFFTTNLFYVRTWPVKLWAPLPFIGYAVLTYFFTKVMLWITAIAIAAVIVVGLLVLVGYLIARWVRSLPSPPPPTWQERQAKREQEEREEEERRKRARRRRETLNILWQWIVAKKHRICPIIEAR